MELSMSPDTAYLAHELSRDFPRTAAYVRLLGTCGAALASQAVLAEARAGARTPLANEVSCGYCALVVACAEGTETCSWCGGEQEVVRYGSGSGFAGGAIYWSELACGHTNVDESGDVSAAH